MDASALFESPFSDPEIRAAIDAAPDAMGYAEIAAELRRRFGDDRAWSVDRIRAYCLLSGAALRGHRFRFAADSELLAYIEDRIGRVPFAALADACRARFGPARAPSRSSLHRYGLYLTAFLRSPTADSPADPRTSAPGSPRSHQIPSGPR